MKDFLIIYFILSVLAIIFNLIRWWIRSPDDPKINWQEKLAGEVLEWCITLYPIHKQNPQLTLVNIKSKLAGDYCFSNNRITIYQKNNKMQSVLVNTVIHEFVHYYLITSEKKNNLYAEQLGQFGYENHPQEIWCCAVAEKLTKTYLNKKIQLNK